MHAKPINSPCTDPLGQVFELNGRFFRGIFASKEEYVRKILSAGWFNKLIAEGLFVKTWVTDQAIEGFSLVLASEHAPFDVPSYSFDRRTLAKCVLGWLSANKTLLENGFYLGDCHFGNFMQFGKNDPKLIDLGSIHPLDELKGYDAFPCVDDFFRDMLVPLAVIYKKPEFTRLARLVIRDGPINGPLCAEYDSPPDLAILFAEEVACLKSIVHELDACSAVAYLANYIKDLTEAESLKDMSDDLLPFGVLSSLDDILIEDGTAVCLGANVFPDVVDTLGARDILVIDECLENLEGLGRFLEVCNPDVNVSFQHANIINRDFLDAPPLASFVICHLPFVRYWHNSFVMYENISRIIFEMTKNNAVVSLEKRDSKGVVMIERVFDGVTKLCDAGDDVWYMCGKA